MYTCDWCGEQFSGHKGNVNKYCSRACSAKGNRNEYVTHYLEVGSDYESWKAKERTVAVHALLAIADGADPYKVFGSGYSVDHVNGCKIDNRRCNVEVVDNSEHGRKDGQKWTKYSHENMLRKMHKLHTEHGVEMEKIIDVLESDNGWSR